MIIDRDKERAREVEAYLELWAKFVRGNVNLGYPHITQEAAAFFGKSPSRQDWPETVEEVERAVCCMSGSIRMAIVRMYVYRRHINSIARELKCSQRRVNGLLSSGRTFIDSWMQARMAA